MARKAKTARLPNGAAETAAAPLSADSLTHDGEDIAAEAYRIYCERGFEDGHDLEHWLEAERRVRGHRGADSSHV